MGGWDCCFGGASKYLHSLALLQRQMHKAILKIFEKQAENILLRRRELPALRKRTEFVVDALVDVQSAHVQLDVEQGGGTCRVPISADVYLGLGL